MAAKKAYQERVETQLAEWRADIQNLRRHLDKATDEVELKYKSQVQKISAKHEVAQQKLQALKQTGTENWQATKVEVDRAMNEVQQSFSNLVEKTTKEGKDVLSWATGLAKKHKLHSIGWAEGLAKEDREESIGWAEGIAKEDPVESKGWAEGYDKK